MASSWAGVVVGGPGWDWSNIDLLLLIILFTINFISSLISSDTQFYFFFFDKKLFLICFEVCPNNLSILHLIQ